MNFYEILNISKTANPEEIKKAFRIKAQQYHPDKNPNNPEAERKFKEINSAYEILSNKQKKEEYDKKISPQRSWNNPEDLFADLFGRMNNDDNNNNPFHPSQGRWHGQVKQKYNTTITLSIADTLEKKQILLDIESKDVCRICHGTAVEKNAIRCNKCGGLFDPNSPCNICNGSGIIYKSCEICSGVGFKNLKQSIPVTVPHGVISNTQLKFETQEGTIIATVNIIYPPEFKNNPDGKLVKEIAVPYHIAVLGGEYTVDLIENKSIKVKFPPMTEGQLIKIKGKGLYSSPIAKEREDLYLSPKIKIPKNISEKHKTIIEELAMICQSEENNKNE